MQEVKIIKLRKVSNFGCEETLIYHILHLIVSMVYLFFVLENDNCWYYMCEPMKAGKKIMKLKVVQLRFTKGGNMLLISVHFCHPNFNQKWCHDSFTRFILLRHVQTLEYRIWSNPNFIGLLEIGDLEAFVHIMVTRSDLGTGEWFMFE